MTTAQTADGLRCAVRQEGKAAAYCALSIHVGTSDEGDFSSGIAHFLEHTLFKGTRRRSSESINNCLERLGGELNAFTTKEEIVLHATVLKEDIRKAVALLLEIAFEASFPEGEIEIEKGVVLDEIASYKDSPADDIYDVFEEKLFGNSPLARPILGTEESVKAITPAELRRFRETFFLPDRMALTIVSPLPEKQTLDMALKLLSGYSPLGSAGSKEEKSTLPATCSTFNVMEDKGNHEVNCIIGGKAPAMWQKEERFATVLLCNMLGGPSTNSILGTRLREKHGWVYNVECSYTPYRDTGVATIQFGCDRQNLKRCTNAIWQEIRKMQTAPLPEARLKAAKRQLLGQNAIGLESGEAQCISMGKSLICFGRIPDDSDVVVAVQNISAALVQKMAREIFSSETASSLTYL